MVRVAAPGKNVFLVLSHLSSSVSRGVRSCDSWNGHLMTSFGCQVECVQVLMAALSPHHSSSTAADPETS